MPKQSSKPTSAPVFARRLLVSPLVKPTPVVTPVVSTATVTTPSLAYQTRSIFQSKKFFYSASSMALAIIFYLLNVVLITNHPAVAASYLSLFNTLMSFIAGITSGLLGIHTFMDYATATTNTISNVLTSSNQASPLASINSVYNFSDAQKQANVAASRANTI